MSCRVVQQQLSCCHAKQIIYRRHMCRGTISSPQGGCWDHLSRLYLPQPRKTSAFCPHSDLHEESHIRSPGSEQCGRALSIYHVLLPRLLRQPAYPEVLVPTGGPGPLHDTRLFRRLHLQGLWGQSQPYQLPREQHICGEHWPSHSGRLWALQVWSGH